MRRTSMLFLLAAACWCAGCEDRTPAAGAGKPTGTPSATPAPAPAGPATPAPAPKPTGDPAVGDTISMVYAKWSKPEVFKLSLQGDAMFYEFSQMPPGINPDAKLTLYYAARGKAIVFTLNGTTEEVASISDISQGERDMVDATAKRNNAPAQLPIPTLPAPGGGP